MLNVSRGVEVVGPSKEARQTRGQGPGGGEGRKGEERGTKGVKDARVEDDGHAEILSRSGEEEVGVVPLPSV